MFKPSYKNTDVLYVDSATHTVCVQYKIRRLWVNDNYWKSLTGHRLTGMVTYEKMGSYGKHDITLSLTACLFCKCLYLCFPVMVTDLHKNKL